MTPCKVLIVGCGFAGIRFFRVLEYLQNQYSDLISLEGICDTNQNKLIEFTNKVKVFSDINEALKIDPNVIVVAVNEYAHFEVLNQLEKKLEGRRLLLCEKPLTETLSQAQNLKKMFSTFDLSLNFVERFSPIIDKFFDWKRQHPNLQPMRVEFFWGKYKIADKRPTMGVLSELSHPLDLIDYLFGFESWEIINVMGLKSNFSPYEESLLDSMDFIIKTENYPIIGHSSFVWSERKREIKVILSNGKSEIYQVVFTFDIPKWDCDKIEIFTINYDKDEKNTELEFAVTNNNFPNELHQVFKVYEYTRCSINAFVNNENVFKIVGYNQAFKIQLILEELQNTLDKTNAMFKNSIFNK